MINFFIVPLLLLLELQYFKSHNIENNSHMSVWRCEKLSIDFLLVVKLEKIFDLVCWRIIKDHRGRRGKSDPFSLRY